VADALGGSAGGRLAVDDGRARVTHEALGRDVLGLRERVPAGGGAVVTARHALVVAAALVALDGWAGRVDLVGALSPGAPAPGAVVLGDDLADVLADGRASTRADGPASTGGGAVTTRWRLYTSGTTGEPKPVDHTLASLARSARPSGDGPSRRWGLLYEPTRMAGTQVLLQALRAGEAVLDATRLPALADRLRFLAEHGADSLSATPTLWRQVLQTAEPGALRLAQVTLGGEIADQGLLDALRAAFPGARVTHVFASTETGTAFAVSDGRAGFPLDHLTSGSSAGVDLQVRDGVLFVHAPGSSTAGPDGYASTGDLVQVVDDRVHFLGRASGVVNVGGATVAPEQVEDVLRSHPGVADAVVVPRRNPFSGWILTARVAAVPGTSDDERSALPARLRHLVADELPSTHVPAAISLVDELTPSATGKAGRR
jgi:acyl-coenzyme A synthetase/AMP-(fatty) acid ligase